MSNTIIKVENLSKQYRLGQVGTGSLSHDINRFWHRLRGHEDPYLKIGEENNRESRGNTDYVWALNNINFDIQQGDRVGIIGRNGAGKSTLLKILSRTTSPTKGSVKIKGQVASLLEVGTGFHPDLSGRDNIFLNGAILGMSKKDIKGRFDEIVDFSGVERYIDTPVKRYSSGMYVRLAFAVAAHLESDILIVDEVLAVGDTEFQKKCLRKMGNISKGQGKTIVFVSHSMNAIASLCSTGILLNNGKTIYTGEISKAIIEYNNSIINDTVIGKLDIGFYSLKYHPNKLKCDYGILSIKILVNGEPSDVIYCGDNVNFIVEHCSNRDMSDAEVGIVIKTKEEIPLIGINNKHIGDKISLKKGEVASTIISFPVFPIYGEGEYFINLYFGDQEPGYEMLVDAFTVFIKTKDIFEQGRLMDPQFNKFFYDKIKIFKSTIS